MKNSSISLWPYASVNFCYYGFMGGVLSYLAIILTHRGFSSVEIGQLVAIYMVVRIATGQLLAYFSDIKGRPLLFFQLGILLSILTLAPTLFIVDKVFSFYVVIAALTAYISVLSQLEVLTLFVSNNEAKVYNRIRMFGSIGFICASILVGWLTSIVGAEGVLYFGNSILVVMLGLSFAIKEAETSAVEHTAKSDVTAGFWSLCFQSGFVVFFVASVLLQMSFAPYVSFFTQYLSLNGYEGLAVGSMFALGTFCEIFMFMIAGSILARFSIKKLLFVCLALTGVRWLVQGHFVDYTAVMLLTQVIHALSFGLIHSTSIYYISRHFDKSQQNRGQFIYLGITFGLGGSIGAWLTGLTWQDGAGSDLTFVLAGSCALAAAILVLFTPSKKFVSP